MQAGAVTVSAPGRGAENAKLRQVAEAFEAVFLRQMIGAMRAASLGEDILGNDAGSQFRDLADARTAESMAARGAIGVADLLMAQLDKTGAAP